MTDPGQRTMPSSAAIAVTTEHVGAWSDWPVRTRPKCTVMRMRRRRREKIPGLSGSSARSFTGPLTHNAAMPEVHVRIMLVDDHAIVRAGFRRLLEQQSHCQIVAEAGDAETAYALFVQHQPDVVLLDLSMPGVGGMELVRRMSVRLPSARILVFSMHEDALLAERVIQLGARGYVTKSSAPEVLATAINDMLAGKVALSPDIAQALALLRVTGEGDPLSVLSTRELEIFRLIARGQTVPAIAALLNLSAKTVANYHSLIKQKLGINSDVELVLLAQRREVI
jgi:two-component system, NarL family, invasion response regulator UvrY